MCSACGYPASPGHWTEAGIRDVSERLRARYRREEILRRVLKVYGLTAHDGGFVPGLQVSDFAGNTVIARDLAEVWGAAERLCGYSVDPLDARFTAGEATAEPSD